MGKALNRTQARHWLRCMGWCLSDEDLDEMLTSGGAPKGRRGSIEKFAHTGRMEWPLGLLEDIVDRMRYKQNQSLDAVTIALRRLANNCGKIPRQRMFKFAEAEFDIHPEDLEHILLAMGLADATALDVDTFARKLLERVIAPKSVLEA